MKKLSASNLVSLLDSYVTVSSSLSSDETLHKIMDEAAALLNAEAASIFLVDEAGKLLYLKIATNMSEEERKDIVVPFGKGIVGYVAETGQLVNTKDTKDDKRFYDNIDKKTGMKTTSCLTVPLIIENRIIGAAQVLNKKKHKFFDSEDEMLLTEFARLASITLDKALMHEQIVQMEKIETDLEIASHIQNGLLPSSMLTVKDYEFRGFYKPAKYVSGDYFDYFKIADNEIFFTIGDVTGKGAHASLLMASVEAFLSASFEYKHSLTDVVFKLNNFFSRKTPDGIFVTMFFGILNTEARELTYINAGHTAPVIVKPSGEIKLLEATDVVLGVMENWKYEVSFASVKPEDFLFAYTDGITEAQNINGELFGIERLLAILKRNTNSPLNLLSELPEEIKKHSHSAQQTDDISFVLISGKE